ncbi:PAS domain-containing protein [Winogradskyella thalassocola]|uniref:PAS domain S-box-containing protein n=1 Tax=Winogradskyella thalassocola TaxID=262004 RepID=A0A1G8JCL0_9FLAO|nr:PAS domain S-box protein [Winogradskyella thalassocola]SDI28989.1 PAS domain S-box-containing protein [Winogradskyella thalassocola]
MKVSIERKILIGYVVNIIVIIALGLIYWRQLPLSTSKLWHWVSLSLIVLSLGMLTTVFFILNAQLKAKMQSELELHKNKNLLQSIIDNTTNAISVKKINGEYLLINKQYQSLFEDKEADLIGKTNADFLPKDIADRYRSADLDVVKAGKDIQVEELIETPEGAHTFLSVKFPLKDTSNRVYAIGTISTNITERKNLSESLKAADAFFNMSIDSLVVASQDKFIKTNPSLSKLLGYSNEELLSKPYKSFIFPEDVASTEEEIKKLKKGTNLINFKNRWLCKDGSVKWLSWNAAADKTTGTLYAIVTDITEKLKLEDEKENTLNALYQSQQQLNMIIENVNDGVLVANANKEVILANDVANALFEIEDDSKISINFSDHFKVLFPDEKKIFPAQNLPAERALNGEITENVDVILKNLETNEMRRVLLSGRPIIDNENHIVAIVVTIKDISRYKKLEEELEQKKLDSRPKIGFKNTKRKKVK